MIFILILLVILILLAASKYINAKPNTITNQNKTYLATSIDYVGGFQEVLERAMAQIYVDKEILKVKLIGRSLEIMVPINNILNVEGKNEEEISKDVTLTRLLVFNIFALGLKKTTVKNHKFITIKYLDSNAEEQYIILEHNNAELIIQKIKLALNDYGSKIESNISI